MGRMNICIPGVGGDPETTRTGLLVPLLAISAFRNSKIAQWSPIDEACSDIVTSSFGQSVVPAPGSAGSLPDLSQSYSTSLVKPLKVMTTVPPAFEARCEIGVHTNTPLSKCH